MNDEWNRYTVGPCSMKSPRSPPLSPHIPYEYTNRDETVKHINPLHAECFEETGVLTAYSAMYDDIMKWKHFLRYWPFVRGIHPSPVNSLHKGQWRGAMMFSWICTWINSWVNNREAGDLRCHRAHYGVTVMVYSCLPSERIPITYDISVLRDDVKHRYMFMS